jgi:5,10-methylenetetrahydromethanopterin reductase
VTERGELVEIGLGIQSNKAPGRYAEVAMRAERVGVDVLSVFSDLLFQPPLPALLEMARVTSRVRLGVACWNPYTLHPYEIAGQFAAIDRASNGRAYLGLARGSWLESVGVSQPQPVAHLEEAVGFIRALLGGSGSGFDGDIFRLAPGARLQYDVARTEVPVLIGSWGPRGADLAGRVADELKVGGTSNPAMVEATRSRIAVGELAAGRPTGSVGVVAGAVTVVSRDGRAARNLARSEVAMYLDVVAKFDQTITLPDGLLDSVGRLVRDGDMDAAGRAIPGDVLDLFAFSGTPDDIAAQAQSLIDAGVSRVEFGTPHGFDELEAIDLIGSAVIPQLDRRRVG